VTDASRIAVNVAGFLKGGLGLGEAARRYVAALQAGGVPVSTTAYDVPLPTVQAATPKEFEFVDVAGAAEPAFNLVCVNAPELPAFYSEVGPAFFGDRRTIGVWAWEVDKVPRDWTWAFDAVDEIWVYSHYVADIVRPVSPVPVVRMPLPVPEPVVPPGDAAPDLGLDDRFTFLFLFDFFSTMERKNPLGLIEAFKRAFEPGEGPQLLIKSFNGDYKPERLERLLTAAASHPDVHVVDRYLQAAERDALFAASDCYVSLHRAEGFGLTMAEAMAMGKPVIATGYSGNVDFMTKDNSWLVGHTLQHVGPEGENYPSEGIWADPDLDDAARAMREVFEGSPGVAERAERGRVHVLGELAPERIGEQARQRLEELLAAPKRRDGPPPPPPPEAGWPELLHARWKLQHDPLAEAKSAGAKGAAKQASLKAMRPYTYHQDELNDAVVKTLNRLAARLDRLTWTLEIQTGLDAAGRTLLREMMDAARVRPSPEHPAISQPGERGKRELRFDADDGELDADVYRGFEDIFRGDEELVRRRQLGYVDLVREADWVLDVGSGRGEFLDLLRSEGIEARGVDVDEGMVRRARDKGHKVENADALEYLRDLEDGSVPAVFAAQLVEHLPSGLLVEFLQLARRKLAPGGTAILETVNPHMPAALKAFWVDPTHQHPLFPEVLLAHCRFAGFASGRVTFPGGTGEFEYDVYHCPDYAVVCTAPG
jgi:glycosyltransferase involved in cell wall biosynthesis/2-polyprenyl-3-methyl-5-hydroxy-6-metoxy-1,4-benzoquinol methylase